MTPSLSDEEGIRKSGYSLETFEREAKLLVSEGLPPRMIAVAMLLSAVEFASHTECLTPTQMQFLFDRIMKRFALPAAEAKE